MLTITIDEIEINWLNTKDKRSKTCIVCAHQLRFINSEENMNWMRPWKYNTFITEYVQYINALLFQGIMFVYIFYIAENESLPLKTYIGSAKTYGFCIFVCFAFTYVLLSCLHTCILSSDIKRAHLQNIWK